MDVREKLVELLGNLFCGDYGIDGCDSCKYNTEVMCSAHACADRLIANGVTVQEWHSVSECMPEDLAENKGKKVINCIVEHDPYGNGKTTAQFRQRKYDSYYNEWHWSKIGGCTVTRWTMMPQPPKGE